MGGSEGWRDAPAEGCARAMGGGRVRVGTDVPTLRLARQGRFRRLWHVPLRRFVTAAITAIFLLLFLTRFWGELPVGRLRPADTPRVSARVYPRSAQEQEKSPLNCRLA